MAGFRSKAIIEFKGKDFITKTFQKVSNQLQKTTAKFRRASLQFQKVSNKFRNSANNFRSAVTPLAIGGVGLAYAMKQAVMETFEFNKSMNTVFSKAKIGSKSFEELKEKALELGISTRFTATQAADGMVYLAKSGLDTGKVFELITPSLLLAQSTNTTLAQSADYLTNIMRAMRIETSKATWVADRLALTTSRTNTDLEELAQGLSYVAPQARGSNVELEELIATVSLLGNIGIKGSAAGTAFRRILVAISDKVVQKKLRAIGVEVKDQQGNFRKFTSIIESMAKALRNSKQVARAGFLKELFGIRAISVIQNMADGDFFTKISRGLVKELNNAEGTLDDMSEKMNKGIVGGIFRLISAVSALRIKVGEDIWKKWGDSVEELTKKIRKTAEDSKLLTQFVEIASKYIIITAAVTGLSIALVVLSSTLNAIATIGATVVGTFVVLKKVIVGIKLIKFLGIIAAFVGLPIWGLALAFAAIVGSVILIYTYWDKIVKYIKMAWNWVSRLVSLSAKHLASSFINVFGRKNKSDNLSDDESIKGITTLEKIPANISRLGAAQERETTLESMLNINFSNVPRGTTYNVTTPTKEEKSFQSLNVGMSFAEEL